MVIVINASDGSSLEGAPFDLYAPLASQSTMQPYLSGVVGQGNTIRLERMPAGQYRLVIRPEGLQPIDLTIPVDTADSEVVVHVESILQIGRENPNNPSPVLTGPPASIMSDGTAGSIGMGNDVESPVMVTGLPDTGVNPPYRYRALITLFTAIVVAGLISVLTPDRKRI